MMAVLCLILSGCAEKEMPAESNSDYVLLDEVPGFSGEPYVEINGNVPDFTKAEIRKAKRKLKKGKRFMKLSKLDSLGRCGTVVCIVGKETMPEGERIDRHGEAFRLEDKQI